MTDSTEQFVYDLGTALDFANHERRVLRRVLADLTGAAAGTLHAIHLAGGYHVADPRHQEPVRLGIEALERALATAAEWRRTLPTDPIPLDTALADWTVTEEVTA